MKIALIGGHMAPALGFISALPKNVDIVYIGRQHVFEGDSGNSLEYEKIREKGIPFSSFTTGRIQRGFGVHTIPSLLKLPKGFVNALQILTREKPDIVVGFGGYLSVPLGIAASILHIPLVIHEQTLDAGLANKFLASFAKKICISWDSSRLYFPKEKTVLTGIPLLPFHARIPQEVLPHSRESLPLLLITGGSGGSHVINDLLTQILPQLLSISKIIHQTGDAKEFRDYEKLLEKKNALPFSLQKRYSVVKFIDPEIINTLFEKTDVVIGRSGINTVAALLLLKKKCVLIPLPIGQKNEQLKNAQLLESEGLSIILKQQALSHELFYQTIMDQMKKTIHEKKKWEIPIKTHGADNLTKEVLSCLSQHHNEK